MIVVAGIDQNFCRRARMPGEVESHPPIGDIGVVEGGFERFVFNQETLIRGEFVVSSF